MWCIICLEMKTKYVKTKCGHECCNKCFIELFKSDPTFPMECFICHTILTDNECLKYLPPEEYIKFKKSKKYVRSKMDRNLFMCRNNNCDGEFRHQKPGNLTRFVCIKCNETNCLNCDAVHKSNETCEKWMARNSNIIEGRLQNKLENDAKIKAKNGMYCVGCGLFCERDGRCYGLKCPQCKTALCIITQQARWGPKGIGDTSGGCKCSDKKKCHPDCNGCLNDIDLSIRVGERCNTEFLSYLKDYIYDHEYYFNEPVSSDSEYLDCIPNIDSDNESDYYSANEE